MNVERPVRKNLQIPQSLDGLRRGVL